MAFETQQQYNIIDWIINNNLDTNHKLLRLSRGINWDEIIDRLRKYYSTKGRRSKRIRMMAGLHILKHMYDLSDEQVVEGLRENVYWMAFCGAPTDQIITSGAPVWLDSSTMTKFRKRIGAEGIKAIEEVVRDQIISEHKRRPRVMIVDTTAMEKHIAYPTDANLLDKGRKKIVKIIRKIRSGGVEINTRVRSYARLGKKALCEINKFGRVNQKKFQDSLKELVKYAEHVVSKAPVILKEAHASIKTNRDRQIKRLCQELKESAELTKRVVRQSMERLSGNHIPDKLYSLHEPAVTCIKKGKRRKEQEYGCKVSLAISEKGYVIAHQEYPDNRHDNQTLDDALNQWDHAIGRFPETLSADRGYRYKGGNEPENLKNIARVVIPSIGRKKPIEEHEWWFKKYKKKRSSIEAVISHLKYDHRADRCRYKGFEGDKINMSLAVIAWNAKKWACTMA